MCGICGEIVFNGKGQASPEKVEAMTKKMAPRGPDGRGIYAQGPVAFGHRRLKIIDLSDAAQQPMHDPQLGMTIVFNGCIYNYKEVREKLEALGYSFFSTGDTEVILKAWHAWNVECVNHLNGMFAFAIHERDSGRLVLARDRLGIKPLYISQEGDTLRFASSMQAMLAGGVKDKSINPAALHHYMTFHSVVPAPHTIINGIRKLPPATMAIFEKDGSRKDIAYWQLVMHQDEQDRARSEDEWRDMVLETMRKAVRRRLVADVPVGVLLSGGLDSSLITGLLAEEGQKDIQTFSVGFQAVNGESGDEFKYSDIIAKEYDTTHHQIFVEHDRLLENLPNTFEAMSEPMVSYDNIGFYLLSEEVSKHVKVVQSGQGADEVFGGYHWYPPLMESSDPVSDYADVFFDREHDEYGRAVHDDYFDKDYSREFVTDHFGSKGAERPVDKALRMDTTIMLTDDPVKRVDNMTMSWGLEARVPFLDHEVVELAGRIPAEHKIRGEGKYVLKEAARKVIPADVIDRPKGYFPVPALKYIDGPYLDFVRDSLSSREAQERGLFRKEYVDTLLQDPKGHITKLRGSKLWQVALLEMWMQAHHI